MTTTSTKDTEPTERTSGASRSQRRDLGRIARLAALAVAVVLLAVAGTLAWQTKTLREDPVLDNRALLDKQASAEVVEAVTRGLVQVLSYNWQQPDLTRAAADELLAGQAREEYDTLFESLQERAPGQKLVLAAQVQVIGVQKLSANDATLLVFVDQSSTREKDDESSVSAAQLLVEVERTDRSWLITGLQTL